MFRILVILFGLLSVGSIQETRAAGLQSINLFGGAVAGYNVKNKNIPWSVMLGGGFEYGTKRYALYADLHTLPLFESRFGPNDEYKASFVMATLGMTVGNNIIRVGPYVTGGYVGVSAGARLVLTPKGGPRFGWHGMEYRLGYYMPNVVYGAALYTWRFSNFGPRKKK